MPCFTLFYSPLESFRIIKIIGINSELFNFNYSLTNNSFYLLLGLALLSLLFASQANYAYSQAPENVSTSTKRSTKLSENNNDKSVSSLYSTNRIQVSQRRSLIPSNTELIAEIIYASTLAMSRVTLGNIAFLPFIISIFGLILATNLISNVPYSYAVASSISFSLGSSLAIFIAVTSIALFNKYQYFFANFVPANTPAALLPMLIIIELLSYMARAVSLGVRLFANLVAGHTLLTIISTMANKILFSSYFGVVILVLPIALLTALIGLEIAVAIIQAYVFTILTSIYINEANAN